MLPTLPVDRSVRMCYNDRALFLALSRNPRIAGGRTQEIPMNLKVLLAAMVCVAACFALLLTPCAADTDQPVAKPIFLRTIPADLQKEIDAIEAGKMTGNPLSESERKDTEQRLAYFDPRSRDSKRCKGIDDHFAKLGVRAIPVIARALVSQDEGIRSKAMERLAPFLGKVTPENKAVRDAVMPLLERSLFDRARAVRENAAGDLWRLADRKGSCFSPRLVSALRTMAESDPDPMARDVANNVLRKIGKAEGLPEPDLHID